MGLPLDPQTLPIAATGFPAPIERHWDTLCRNNLGQLVDGNGVIVAIEAGAVTGDGNTLLKTSVRVGAGSAAGAALDGGDGRVVADGALAGFLGRDRADSTKFFNVYKNGTMRVSTTEGGDIWVFDPMTGIFTLAAATVIAAFTNSWVDAGAGLGVSAARYRKNLFGDVQLVGVIKGGAINTVAFTLPVGYRPFTTLFGAGFDLATNAATRLDIQAGGAVVPVTGTNPTGISFSVTFPTVF